MKQPISLYLHIPFCRRKCFYCDFNTYAGIEHLISPFVEALQREVRRWGPLAQDYEVTTVFFGGGTPSLLSGAQVQAIMDTCRATFAFAPDPEVTMEANPSSTEYGRLAAYRQAGVDRLSFGAQSFHADELEWLGRLHGRDDIAKAMRAARRAGFERVNLDLIYGLPEQSLGRWEVSVRMALDTKPDHLSLYALTVEEGTPLDDWVRTGRTKEPDPDMAADQYLLSGRILAEAGFEQYEISNWAKPGQECRHNLTYWHNLPYIGLGPGAHGRIGDIRYSVIRSPQEYVKWEPSVGGEGGLAGAIKAASATDEFTPVDAETDLLDTLMLGLRLVRGVRFADVLARHGVDVPKRFGPTMQELTNLWLLAFDLDGMWLTYRGRLLANEVFVRLMAAAKA